MSQSTDVRPVSAELYFLPVSTRVPLKFGRETVDYVTCARCRVTVESRDGRRAVGWGETPLSVTWVWPSDLTYEARHRALKDFCERLVPSWANWNVWGHPLEIGHDFITQRLPTLLETHDAEQSLAEPMPYLASLVCCSLFDLAVHDAYGNLHERDIYATYDGDWMNRDLAAYLEPTNANSNPFCGKYPKDYLVGAPPTQLLAWHLVGGADPLDESELGGHEPNDGYPVLLADWIERDGLRCLKIKLRGNDAEWDYARLVKTGLIALQHNVLWLTADFNCTVTDPSYVTRMLDRLCQEHPRIYASILYVEQPFPYDLEASPIDVHAVSARKPLFLDESAHDWQHVRLGRSLGWTGVALKTCKTQTGAILSACWAKQHGMTLMVQDLTNPMLAQLPHLRLAAHVGTIMGVETNSMQFYPEVSRPEAAIHPGMYQRRAGQVDLASCGTTGFGYRINEITRPLPEAAASY